MSRGVIIDTAAKTASATDTREEQDKITLKSRPVAFNKPLSIALVLHNTSIHINEQLLKIKTSQIYSKINVEVERR